MSNSIYSACFLLIIYFAGSIARPQDDMEDPENDVEEPVEENYEQCNPPYFGMDTVQEVALNVMRMGPNSKYFIAAGVTNTPIKEVENFCGQIGLQPAQIQNNVELKAIDFYLKLHAPEDLRFSLGLSDEVKEGSFIQYDGTPMSFHSFAETQPNNRMNMESCVAVHRHPHYEQYVYLDVTCDTEVTPICMFKPGSQCYLSSPLSTVPVSSGLELVGSSSVRDYYVGMKQYSRAIAAAECEKAGYHLVDFNTGLNNNQILYDMMTRWIETNMLFPRISFWTGAKLMSSEVDGEKALKFLTSGKHLGDLSDWPSLQWDTDEPSDSSTLDLEQCISVILYRIYSPSQDNIFTLATTNCRLPHYPLCYKEKAGFRMAGDSSKMSKLGKSSGTNATSQVKTPEGCPLKSEIRKVNLSEPSLSNEEITQLSQLSRTGSLSNDKQRFTLDTEKPWLTNFIDAVYKITRKVSPEPLIPREFLNIMHNLILLYYNSILENVMDPEEETVKIINEATALLQQCAKGIAPFEYEVVGGLPARYGLSPISLIEESVEMVYRYLDVIIESYWFSYLTAIGSCYHKAPYSKTKWLMSINEIFTKQFMAVFEERWTSKPVRIPDYGVIVGDMEFGPAFYSLKIGAVAAFVESGFAELYFPRPLYTPGRSVVDTVNVKV